VASLPHELANLFIYEEQIINVVGRCWDEGYRTTSEAYENVDLYVRSWRSRYQELPSNSHYEDVLVRLAGNPVHVFNLMDRLVNLIPRILEGMTDPVDLEEIKGILDGIPLYPEIPDLVESTQALMRIQFAYKLDPVDLSNGLIAGVQTEASISWRQMMYIADVRLKGSHPLRASLGPEYALAIIWAEGALTKAGPEHREDIERFLEAARGHHNFNWRSPAGHHGNYPNEEYFVRRIKTSEKSTGLQLRREEEDFIKKEKENLYQNAGFNIHDFYSLCRGESLDTSCSSPVTQCRVSTNSQPYFILAPLRIEVLCQDPVLYLYHDFLTQEEMSYMKSNVLSVLTAGTVIMKDDPTTLETISRSQSVGWLFDHQHQLLYKLSKKVSLLTGLETFRPKLSDKYEGIEAEAWQVGMYGPGGHYLPHRDALIPEGDNPLKDHWQGDLWVGDRIATLMFYLSSLVGGRTAFTKMRVAAQPREGTAVFWYNLHKDGKVEDLSDHGACPTILGIKWVSNKWIREGAQIWRRPCGLNTSTTSSVSF